MLGLLNKEFNLAITNPINQVLGYDTLK